jgi:serine/threonine protein kinase
MGDVYGARDSRLDRVVAINVLSGELVSDRGFRARFEREARLVAALSRRERGEEAAPTASLAAREPPQASPF